MERWRMEEEDASPQAYQTHFNINCRRLQEFLSYRRDPCGSVSGGGSTVPRWSRAPVGSTMPGKSNLYMGPYASVQGDSSTKQRPNRRRFRHGIVVGGIRRPNRRRFRHGIVVGRIRRRRQLPYASVQGGSRTKQRPDGIPFMGSLSEGSGDEDDSATNQRPNARVQGGSTSKKRPDTSILYMWSLSKESGNEDDSATNQRPYASVQGGSTSDQKNLSLIEALSSIKASERVIVTDTYILEKMLLKGESDNGEGGSGTKHLPEGSQLTEASGSREDDIATQQLSDASLTKASGSGEDDSVTQQWPDGSIVCRLKDVVCLLLSSYSISIEGTGHIYKWISKVLKFINNCRLAKVGLDYAYSKSIDSETMSPSVLEEIEFYLPYWFPSPNVQPEEVLGYHPLGAKSQSVDLAIESAIAQLKSCFAGEIQENIKLIAITGEGAKKVTNSLKDSSFVKKRFGHVLSITVSEEWNILDLHKEIRRQLLGLAGIWKPVKDVIIFLDDVHDRLDLSEIMPLCSYQYLAGVFLHFKMMVVTRLQRVDEPLAVDLEIRMEDHLVPWSVFSKNAGQILHTSTAVQSIASSIVKRCRGHLPAITLLARALRGTPDTDVWEDALYHIYSPDAKADMIYGLKCPDTKPVMINGLKCPNIQPVMIYALKFCLSRQNRETRQYINNNMESRFSLFWLTSREGDRAEKDLLDAFLLHRFEYGKGLIMEEQIHQILLNSSLLDACEMLEDGESNATEIELVNGGISQLPHSPSCPLLTGLFLQMNSDLTLIPPSFFRHMVCLKTLNLSNTSISSLPESLFQLSTLEKLYLKDCELFMVLPPQIKELENLKELDLEGTALKNLPKEIGDLKNLTCLKVSFHGALDFNGEYPTETMISTGVLSKLSMLMTLSIDVNPADKRWDEAVKVVIGELSYLKQLKSLEMYLPEVTLLDELIVSLPSLIHDSRMKFKLTVGRHQRSIMSRVPRVDEGKFLNLKKCLKYVYDNEGDSNISAQVMKVLKYSDSFFLSHHFSITDLTKLGIGNLDKLRFCVLGENDKLVTILDGTDLYKRVGERSRVLPLLNDLIIYRMKNLKSICEGPLQIGTMRGLKSLTLNGCPQLEVVFTPWLLLALHCLEELIIEDCPAISSLVSEKNDETEVLNLQRRGFFKRLFSISLHHLPELESIFSGLCREPAVKRVSIYDCPKLQADDFFSDSLGKFRGEEDWLLYLNGSKHTNAWHARRVFVPFKRGSHFKTQLAADGFNF